MRIPTTTSIRSLALLAGLLALPSLPAPGQESGFYFNAGIGPAIAEDVGVSEFLGSSSGKVRLDPGFHFTAAGGYHFTRWLAVEMETGYIGNNIDRIGSSSPDAFLSHVPFLANVVLRYDADNFRLVPYASAGAGGDSSIFFINDSLGLDGSDADVVFAFQVSAGLLYKINETMSAGLGYKYYYADAPSWDVQNSAGRIRFGVSRVHLIAAVFNMKF
ncbi:MAG TPA: outer membrane beta-barrel protein [Verrucomicrobiae bacterium]|jgi:opacity protein-like surface antigen|nr:outer membrane beta-barrel protein [Verrucomicrobiae bacterium]